MWRYMMKNKSIVEENITWKINSGNCSFWWDDWLGKAWEICRHRKNLEGISSQLWAKNIPFKMSFLLWRALRNKLPTNENLAIFGVEPVKCFCCINQGWDDVDHIFNGGHFAAHIWNYLQVLWELISSSLS
ncbi:hypothetical protein R3W88_033521 [Solanum pinnatisectum]|uniref:Reverse transcriptase zinc-binding domain-containing protein n=1 Tax=Solanum pinnatisectum TaxID=50273 RepID=A0AAV9K2H5_9SOLN|nr:hypothetical protein R3W88_033521 [Solanum pinnatisectum]